MSGHQTGQPRPEDSVDRAAETAETAIEDAQVSAETRIADAQISTEERIAEARDAATARVRQTERQVKTKIRETEAKVRQQVAEVERTVGGLELSEPTPAGSVDEAVRQASELRRAIDRDLDALEAKLPPGEELKEKAKTYGGAAAGVLALAGAAALGLKQRGERKRVEREARAYAAAVAAYLPEYLPEALRAAAEPRAERERSGRGGAIVLTLLAAVIGAVIVRQRAGGVEEEPDLWGPA